MANCSPKKRTMSAPDLTSDLQAFTEKHLIDADNTRSFSESQTRVNSTNGSDAGSDSGGGSPLKHAPLTMGEMLFTNGFDKDWRVIFSTKPTKSPDVMTRDERAAEGWIDIQAIRQFLPAPPKGLTTRATLHMVRNGSDRLETLEVGSDMDHLQISASAGRRARDYWYFSLRRAGKVRVWYREVNGMVTIIISALEEQGCCDFRAPKELEPKGYALFLRILADRITALATVMD